METKTIHVMDVIELDELVFNHIPECSGWEFCWIENENTLQLYENTIWNEGEVHNYSSVREILGVLIKKRLLEEGNYLIVNN